MSAVGFWWSQLDNDQKKKAIAEAATEGAERFQLYWDTLLNSVGLETPGPRDRIIAYRRRSADAWAQLRVRFPKQYAEDMDDWHNLEQRLGPELDGYAPGKQPPAGATPPEAPQAPIVQPPPVPPGAAPAPTAGVGLQAVGPAGVTSATA